MRSFLPAVAVLLLFGPLAQALQAAGPEAPAAALQWPSAPGQARLRFVGEIKGEGVGLAKKSGFGSFIRKVLGVVTGSSGSPEHRLVQPTGIYAVDGVLYAADPGRRGVLRYDLAKAKGEWLPKGRAASLVSPVSVAAAPDGRVFILDSALRKVFVLDAKGKVQGELEGDPQGMGKPAGLAISADRIYVSDVANHRIAVYGLEGVFLHSFGARGAGPGEFNYPTYLWFDRREKQLWACDSGNFRVQWFDPDGKPLGRFGEPGNRPGYLPRPHGLARDSNGDVYLTDAAFDAMQIFDPKGSLLLFVGQAGPEPGQFNLPGGVSVDEQDRVFVADTYNARIQVLQYLKERNP
ncbi:MAG: hypothetical protein HZB91_06265 [Elusimicrobia bacterium]|nr:hypothetical protein [Elusimicrobiota bacterium]